METGALSHIIMCNKQPYCSWYKGLCEALRLARWYNRSLAEGAELVLIGPLPSATCWTAPSSDPPAELAFLISLSTLFFFGCDEEKVSTQQTETGVWPPLYGKHCAARVGRR